MPPRYQLAEFLEDAHLPDLLGNCPRHTRGTSVRRAQNGSVPFNAIVWTITTR